MASALSGRYLTGTSLAIAEAEPWFLPLKKPTNSRERASRTNAPRGRPLPLAQKAYYARLATAITRYLLDRNCLLPVGRFWQPVPNQSSNRFPFLFFFLCDSIHGLFFFSGWLRPSIHCASLRYYLMTIFISDVVHF